jgi:YHS domain-containing protein
MATDPVCGRDVAEGVINQTVGQIPAGAPEVPTGQGAKRFHDGRWWYFCSFQCRQQFLAAPDRYVQQAAEEPRT